MGIFRECGEELRTEKTRGVMPQCSSSSIVSDVGDNASKYVSHYGHLFSPLGIFLYGKWSILDILNIEWTYSPILTTNSPPAACQGDYRC